MSFPRPDNTLQVLWLSHRRPKRPNAVIDCLLLLWIIYFSKLLRLRTTECSVCRVASLSIIWSLSIHRRHFRLGSPIKNLAEIQKARGTLCKAKPGCGDVTIPAATNSVKRDHTVQGRGGGEEHNTACALFSRRCSGAAVVHASPAHPLRYWPSRLITAPTPDPNKTPNPS